MRPSWLKVERATIFLKSSSNRPPVPAITMVAAPVRSMISVLRLHVVLRWSLNRSSIKIPAVTKVEECTKEDTGVGAAIAAGSHLEKGIWALFVKAAKTVNRLAKGRR